MKRPPEKLPDLWLFDSEKLLRELARCRELVLNVPISDPQATHFPLNIAIDAIWNLEEQLRYLLHLSLEQQRAIRRQHDASLAAAPSQNAAPNDAIVRLHTPAPSTNMHRRQSSRERYAKRRRAQSSAA
jgi:hypothetical protein